MGVTLPVVAPLTETWAPVGNEVTLSLPCSCSFSARTPPDISKNAAVNTAIQTILVILRILLGWVIESSLTLLTVQLPCANLTCDMATSGGILGRISGNCLATGALLLSHSFSMRRKGIATPQVVRTCNKRLPFRHNSAERPSMLSIYIRH